MSLLQWGIALGLGVFDLNITAENKIERSDDRRMKTRIDSLLPEAAAWKKNSTVLQKRYLKIKTKERKMTLLHAKLVRETKRLKQYTVLQYPDLNYAVLSN